MRKLVNKYDTYTRKKGIELYSPSKTRKDQAEDTDIYFCLEKYGMKSLVNQTMAQKQLYLDNTNEMSLSDAVRMRDEMDEYFEQCPAQVRKAFGDSTEVFYQKYKMGEFNTFLETGVLTDEQVAEIQKSNSRPNNISTTDNKIDNTNIRDVKDTISE